MPHYTVGEREKKKKEKEEGNWELGLLVHQPPHPRAQPHRFCIRAGRHKALLLLSDQATDRTYSPVRVGLKKLARSYSVPLGARA